MNGYSYQRPLTGNLKNGAADGSQPKLLKECIDALSSTFKLSILVVTERVRNMADSISEADKVSSNSDPRSISY